MADRLRFQRSANETPLCAERGSQLDDRDFSTVSLAQNRIGMSVINLCFSESGRSKFQQIVSTNVGRWVIFLSRGKFVMAAEILSADVPKCATIEGHVSHEDVAALEKAINRK